MISPEDLVRYLQHRKLLRQDESIGGDLAITPASRRNHILKVVRKRGNSYLVKQAVGSERAATIRREVSIYRALEPFAELGRHLPRVYGYDSKRNILVMELLTDSQDLRSYHESHKQTPAGIGMLTGNALADFHGMHSENLACRKRFNDFPMEKPAVFRMHRRGVPSLRQLSAGGIELIKIVQKFGIGRHLERLGRDWRPVSLTHGDLRWDNCLIPSRFPARSQTPLKFIDWEFGGWGDPAWDVAYVLAGYLGYWASLIPVTTESRPDRYLDLAEVPLERMQPALRAFWSSYRDRMRAKTKFGETEARSFLLRSVEYTAAVLLHTAYEEMCFSAQLSGTAICQTQLCLNIFQRPRQACSELLGLPC
jgi:hypothetical protein